MTLTGPKPREAAHFRRNILADGDDFVVDKAVKR